LPFDPARAVVVWHALADDDAIYQSANAALWDINRPLWPDGESIADWGEYIFLPVGAATGFNRQRKNIPVGIAGYRLLNRSDIKLIIASTGVVHDQMLRQILPNDELSSGVIRNGIWQSEDGLIRVLPNLDRRPFLQAMSRANIVYYPTKYEGFGLPAIEAMALGVPLVAGNATSLPEIVGPAGILVNPDSAENFAQGLSNVLNNPTLRNDLVCRGKERSKLFTLQRMGEEMKMVFERLVGQAASDTQLRMIE
jgi:glycosyltransferase involved in cell wall biosynthesis